MKNPVSRREALRMIGGGFGMMAGVPGFGARRGQGAGADKPPEYTPTPLGRYAKVLLSSSEFMFIN